MIASDTPNSREPSMSPFTLMMLTKRRSILLLLAFLLVQPCILHLSHSSNNFTDQSALIAFKSEISFHPNDTIFSAGNWSTTTNFCEWFGVSCSRRRQRVTALNLSYVDLHGTISPHIGNLSFLVSLDLQNNSFSGFLPHEIGNLHRLRELRLSNNLLEGSIPPTLHNCQKLEVLFLYGNNLNGSIPEDLGMLPRVREMNLSQNKLMGTIPSSLGNMSSLEFLTLEYNSLTGAFPLVIFNLSSLKSIGIGGNNLSGTLPVDLCSHCPNLQGLYITDNRFSGKLPSQFNNCRELLDLSLSYNMFDGSISKGFGSLKKLESLYLGGNNLIGNIPPIISNLSMLQGFGAEKNNIKGSVPSDLWRLHNLNGLNIHSNNLTGTIPQTIFNITSLQILELSVNSLSGNLSFDTRIPCPNLGFLYLGGNYISGRIPSYLSNCSNLVEVDLSENLLSGPIPRSLGNLKYLKILSLDDNQLTEESGHQEHNFLTSLTSCTSLEELDISHNPLNITIPETIGNFLASLKVIVASQSQIKGQIPMGIGSLKNLTRLDLSYNNLSGNLPSTLGGLEELQRLHLRDNNIGGNIPEELCQLIKLGELFLSNNKISGSIPNCIGNLNLLQRLNLSYNKLTSSIPLNVWNLENMLFLDLSSNSLYGSLSPNMKTLRAIEYLNLSHNQITGKVPSIIGAFESLSNLDLSKNSFQGDIPDSFGQLKGMDLLDLSNNNLSGAIPKSLEALRFLKYLNLSFNKLSGEIPSGGPFANFKEKSFLGNEALCGNSIFGVPACTSPNSKGARMKQLLLKYIIPSIASIIIFAMLVIMLRRHPQYNMLPSSLFTLPTVDWRMISYQELCRGTNNFCESNLLGIGGFGTVYKGILSDGTTVAVKVLNLHLEDAFKSFDAECKVLRALRHRNLVKVISVCSSPQFKALVLQYMSNYSLEKWIYSHNYCLNLVQRVGIMVDIASALDYLHNGQLESVVHCDLKPSNILLDEDMVAHVGDFGIAKILAENKDATQTRTIGTIGYIAPEYGSEGRVSTKCDIYSYGIILLEMITRKKPTDEMFVGDLGMRQWIASLPDRMEVVDDGLLSIEAGRDVTVMQTILLSILELGLRCSEELPDERPEIKDVVAKVNKIKLALLGNRNRGV
ncbi:probable LRR receptor-like serine/threonine-protein kinase At3g47570 isoform X2 [Quercus robur]|uniref:probable LRR receptor-like serine/threonine-protein kinase At3g47570 isoform X2 n=1 Tax=Quercus robur TaxID=38942 RepID=UPI00216308B6|nr:probable LRR receptor-like serine/threonine-protein kinase At3g47570 isoform X2 [Quercus robur]